MARPPNDPDADFRRFATTGDPAALARVFDATAPRLLLVARHVARHAADAEDLVQATFVAAMRDPTTWEPRRPVLAWLCGILAHKAGDLARHRARRPADPLGEPDALPDDGRAPLDTLLDREAADAIAAALDDLPAAERDVCVLRLVHGLSGVATAHALGARVTEIRVHVYADGSNYLHVVPADGPRFRFDGVRAGSEIELAATLQLADGRSLRFVDRDRFALAPSARVSRTLRIDRRVATIRLRDAAGSPLPTGHPVLIAHAAGTDLVATGAGGVVRLDPAPQDGVQLRVPKTAEHLERARAPLPDPDLVHVEQLAWPEAESSIDRSVTMPR